LVREQRSSEAESLLASGREAFGRCAWEEARTRFEEAIGAGAGPGAYEGLGQAAGWLGDEDATFASFDQAFRLYRDRGDARGAAHVAMLLANASFEFRGEAAVANGWLQRAHRLIDGLEPVPEQGWLSLWEGHLALMVRNDAGAAEALCEQAIELGRAFGDTDLEMLALAVQGLVLVTEGRVDAGISRLDEAAAAVLSEELHDVDAMGSILCYVMDACDRVRDFERASQWCARIKDFVERRGLGVVYAVCRPHYAVVLMWRGDWGEAEQQLVDSERELLELRPSMVVEAIVRMAELRWRQGRWPESADLFKRVEQEPLSQLGRAELALSEGDALGAVELGERYLRRMPPENRIERAAGLELMVRALSARGDHAAVETTLAELRAIANEVGTSPLLGWACAAAGTAALAQGAHDEARRELEDAIFQFERGGAPFEAARARVELARSLHGLSRAPNAAEEAQTALNTFRRLGAERESARAVALLAELGAAAPASKDAAANPAGLTARERDILRLIAAGWTNQEMAGELVLSLRTVERHLSNIYGKIGAEGKVARAAAASYAFRNGLT
jgi:ATP/maltotriose-dependent transcriptional regulator MalT